MKYYITKTEKCLIILVFIFLLTINMIMCFMGMAQEVKYERVVKEKEALMEIVEMKGEMLEKK